MSGVRRVVQGFDLMDVGREYILADDYDALATDLVGLLRELHGSVYCENLHHRPDEYHEAGDPCKVLARIDAKLAALATK